MMRGTCCRKSDRTSRPTALWKDFACGQRQRLDLNPNARGFSKPASRRIRCKAVMTNPGDFSSRSRRRSAAFCKKVPPRFRYPALHPDPTNRPNLLAVLPRFLLHLLLVVVVGGGVAVEEERVRRRVDERSGRLSLRSPPRRRRIDDFDACSSSSCCTSHCPFVRATRHGVVLVDGVERQPGLSRRVRVLVIPLVDGRLVVRRR
jgi:hypothetical protein